MGGAVLDPRLEPIADALRECFRLHDVSQAEVERRAGWPERYVSRLLRGKVRLTFAHLFTILDAVGVDPGEFFLSAYPRSAPALLRKLERLSEETAALRRQLGLEPTSRSGEPSDD